MSGQFFTSFSSYQEKEPDNVYTRKVLTEKVKKWHDSDIWTLENKINEFWVDVASIDFIVETEQSRESAQRAKMAKAAVMSKTAQKANVIQNSKWLNSRHKGFKNQSFVRRTMR
jgi:hypothetical protein